MLQKPRGAPFTRCRDFARMSALEPSEAVQMIMDALSELRGKPDEASLKNLKFKVKKLVNDAVDYCNRRDFPVSLIYTAAELINDKLELERADELTGTKFPLKKITQDDTTFEFAVEDVSVLDSDVVFHLLKPKLNLYRKVRGL